jgi:glutamine transport system permease protein
MTQILLAYRADWSVIFQAIGPMAKGLEFTGEIVVSALFGALLLGLVVALVRMAPFPISVLGFAYVQVFRALSLYIYILWVYFGVPAFLHIDISPLTAAVVCLMLLNSAYLSEVYRSAIKAIDRGQLEAATSLGMGRIVAFNNVILPQAIRVAIPSIMNLIVDMVKDSSIVAVIGASDLMYQTIELISVNKRSFELYTMVGVIYLVIVVVISQLAGFMEKRLRRHLV